MTPSIKEAGRSFASGMLIEIGKWALIATIVLSAWNWLADTTGIRSRDSTDSPAERSGLVVRTDWMTRCQYLENRDGALIPRINAEGQHMCGQVSAR